MTKYRSKLLDYFNKTGESGQALANYQHSARRQNELVLAYLARHPDSDFTRDELHALILQAAPATSVGRALNNLMNRGLIEQTGNYRKGNYGRPQHTWKLCK